jgi:hypothetical protein
MARTLRTVAVWDSLPVMSRRCDAMTASGSRLASAATRSTCIGLAWKSSQATVLMDGDWGTQLGCMPDADLWFVCKGPIQGSTLQAYASYEVNLAWLCAYEHGRGSVVEPGWDSTVSGSKTTRTAIKASMETGPNCLSERADADWRLVGFGSRR